MKKFMLSLFVTTSFLLTGCSDDDDNGNVIGQEETTTYDLYSSETGSTMGTTTFQKNSDNTTTVIVDMEGNHSTTGAQTVHFHSGNAAETGPIILALNDIDATSGVSTTTFSTWEDGTEVSYEELTAYDGYIDIHNDGEMEYVYYSDIGVNELTGESKTYQLSAYNNSDIDGTLTFERRMDNTTLATVNMNNTMSTGAYPVTMYNDNAIDVGTEVFAFETLDGFNMSKTQINAINGTDVTYNDIMNYDGHVRVQYDNGTDNALVAMGDIGQNELTGNTETYTMNDMDGNDTGNFMLSERINGETVATMEMTGTTAGVNHAAFINSGVYGDATSLPTGTLNLVNGANGMGITNLTSLDDGTEMDFDAWAAYNGNVTVMSSEVPTSEVYSYANIGMNAE